ncbi:MAG: elongation factor P [Candidatus Omnitrophica bacterium CG08_land_8_20_14_0_20_41_16]|uniref:Elongation factor P n=1 Tax=Candidatus Sherwoodlollariibacterium unditelluris TaxID=1974757 RepID=A0A2G9YHY9_9BACT|nr:MAG: elongation factor P [Candidatus Omnitrophica bacterium CG23_combo_of_CG06-09_8_20_14_all_41_10]PIS33587.1 MAG: elongation factor P [Candidatus Omnitrophica bacterium CG08_land_8_20_14_0_20_41_16]
MALSINEIKSGLTILVDGNVYMVIDAQHIKPGKGRAFVRAKLKDMKNSNIQEKTFRGEEKIDEAFVDERKLQYQYNSGQLYYFMDQDNFEEITVARESLGDKKKFLKDNIEIMGYFFKNEPLFINLPNFIEFKIIHTEPGIKGDTAKSGTKPAEIETGAAIQVPLFINVGDKIKVDTRTGEYVERVN